MRTRSGPVSAQSPDAQALLSREAGGYAVACRVEDGHDAVAGGLDDLAAERPPRPRQDVVVLRERDAHGVGVVLPEARAALHVGEEEGERAGARQRHRVADLGSLIRAACRGVVSRAR